jgi:hypothetical protein
METERVLKVKNKKFTKLRKEELQLSLYQLGLASCLAGYLLRKLLRMVLSKFNLAGIHLYCMVIWMLLIA